MRVISEKRIWEAKERWPHSATALDEWYRRMKRNSPADFASMKECSLQQTKSGSSMCLTSGAIS